MSETKKKFFKICKRAAAAFIMLAAFVYTYLQINVILNQNKFLPQISDAIIVLGHSLEGEAEIPDEWLVERLEIALKKYNEGFGNYIIVSGGKGYTYTNSVAFSMKNWLINNGIDEDVILMEENAKNTNENFHYSRLIADGLDINSVLVVTNDFHMYRSIMIGKHYFPQISGCAAGADMGFNKFLAYAKEPLSIIKFFALDKLLG